MTSWLTFVLTSLVLAVVGALTGTSWLLVTAILLLGLGLLWATSSRSRPDGSHARGSRS